MLNLEDSSLEQAGESAKLLNLLNTLEAELEIPYIERRRLTKVQKSNSLLELQDAIHEISQRERDLQASIGISKVLIENNDNLIQKNRDLTLDNTRLQSQIDQLNEDLLRSKNQVIILQEKYQTTSVALAHTETKLLKLTSQISAPEHSIPINKKSQEENTISLERYDNDLNEMAERFKKEYDYIFHAKSETEKKCKALEEVIEKAKETQASTDDQFEDLLKKHRALEKNLKKFEEQIRILSEEKEEIEQKFDNMYEKHQALLNLVERQAEDLEILEESRLSRSQQPIQSTEPESLKNELDILEEKINENSLDFTYLQSPDFDPIKRFGSSYNVRDSLRGSMRPLNIYLDPPEPKPSGPDLMKRFGSVANVRASFRSLPRTISVFRQPPISIEARRIRKDPSEEYFTLVTQAIKMNSPYMDVICVVSPKTLYQTAQKNDIPFHKWHIWVEKQLNAAYLQTIYKKENIKSKY